MLSIRRLLVAAAAITATVAAVPAPAGAAAPAPFTLTVPDVGVSTTGTYLPVVLGLAGTPAPPATLDNVHVDVDDTGLAGIADVSNPKPVVGELTAAGGWRLPQLFAKAKAGVPTGKSGTVKVTVSADGIAPLVATATLTVNDVHVVAGPTAVTYTVKDGTEKAHVVLQFTVSGDPEAFNLAFRVTGDEGLEWDIPWGSQMFCWYDNATNFKGPEHFCNLTGLLINPGQTYQVQFTDLSAPAGKPGDKFDFEASYWFGPGATNVIDALTKLPGVRKGNRALSAPLKVAPGDVAPKAAGPGATGTLSIGTPTTAPPSSAPSTAPTTGTTAPTTGTTAAPPAAGGADDGGSGGGLPVTGTNATIVAVLGAMLLAGGLAALVTARRRRTRFTA